MVDVLPARRLVRRRLRGRGHLSISLRQLALSGVRPQGVHPVGDVRGLALVLVLVLLWLVLVRVLLVLVRGVVAGVLRRLRRVWLRLGVHLHLRVLL